MSWKTYEVTMRSCETKTVGIKARSEREALEKAEAKEWDDFEAEYALEINNGNE